MYGTLGHGRPRDGPGPRPDASEPRFVSRNGAVYVSISVFRAIAAELPRFGLRAETILADAGLDPELLTQGPTRVAMADAGRFVQTAVSLTGLPDLGLRIGAAAPTRALQILGPMLESAPSLRNAIELYQRYGSLIMDGTRCVLLESGNRAIFRYEFPYVRAEFARFVAEVSLSFAARIGLGLAGADTRADVVRFRHPQPPHVTPYHQAFNCPVEFEQEHDEVVFDAKLLDIPHMLVDESLCNGLQRRAEELIAALDANTSLGQRTRALLAVTPDLMSIPVDAAAARLGMGSRTFQRKLSSEGASWSSLVEAEQKERACAALAQTNEPIKELAYRIGFSEPSAFHRAFKRWTGMTPSEYRRQKQP